MRERFMSKVAVDPEGCWLWIASRDRDGYGQFKVDGKTRQAHQVAYELFVGPIPAGSDLDHVRARGCRHRHCVNPEHLEPVSRAENTRRGNGPTAANARKSCCLKGHPFDEANTYLRPDGNRMCRACNRESVRRYKDRKRLGVSA